MLPVHHVDVAAATAALEGGEGGDGRSAASWTRLERAAHVVEAQLAAERRALTALAADLADVPPDAELAAQRDGDAAACPAAGHRRSRRQRRAAETASGPGPSRRGLDRSRCSTLPPGPRPTWRRCAHWSGRTARPAGDCRVGRPGRCPRSTCSEASLAEARRSSAPSRDAACRRARRSLKPITSGRWHSSATRASRPSATAIAELGTAPADRLATLQPPPVGGGTASAHRGRCSWTGPPRRAANGRRARSRVADRSAALATATAAAERAAATVRSTYAGLLGSTVDGVLARLRDDVIVWGDRDERGRARSVRPGAASSSPSGWPEPSGWTSSAPLRISSATCCGPTASRRG